MPARMMRVAGEILTLGNGVRDVSRHQTRDKQGHGSEPLG